jgi:hypothetical protein
VITVATAVIRMMLAVATEAAPALGGNMSSRNKGSTALDAISDEAFGLALLRLLLHLSPPLPLRVKQM